jgi:predicted transcriptional regulator
LEARASFPFLTKAVKAGVHQNEGSHVTQQPEGLINLVADIVSAHVSNNNVAVGDVATLVQNVHAALVGLTGESKAPETANREPAVSVRSSVKPDAIVCLVCGSRNKMLKRHLNTAHGLTPAEYRAEFGLKNDYPMVAPNYSEQRSTLARSIGLGSAENRAKRKQKATKPRGKGAKPASTEQAG